jgi:hypothetical protein
MCFECEKCGKNFNRKWDLDRHLYNRKKPCKKVKKSTKKVSGGKQNVRKTRYYTKKPSKKPSKNTHLLKKNDKKEVVSQELVYMCVFCNKAYSRKDNLKRHVSQYCKKSVKNTIDDQMSTNQFEQIINMIESQRRNELKDERTELKELIKLYGNQMSMLLENVAKIKSTTNNNQTNTQNIGHYTNNNNTIKMVAFGEEDLSFVTDEVYKKIIGRGFNSVPTLIKYIHFNKNKPEYQNIFVSNNQNTFTYAYSGKSWDVKSKKDAVKQLIENSSNVLIDKFNELKPKLSIPAIKKFTSFMNKMNDDDIVNWMENEVRMLLYNNRNVPMKRKRVMDGKHINLINLIRK